MARPTIVRDQYVYRVQARQTGAGLSITIPIDVVRSLGWEAGDSMAIVLLDDGVVVSKIDDKENK